VFVVVKVKLVNAELRGQQNIQQRAE
jgi:hypothetical protein